LTGLLRIPPQVLLSASSYARNGDSYAHPPRKSRRLSAV